MLHQASKHIIAFLSEIAEQRSFVKIPLCLRLSTWMHSNCHAGHLHFDLAYLICVAHDKTWLDVNLQATPFSLGGGALLDISFKGRFISADFTHASILLIKSKLIAFEHKKLEYHPSLVVWRRLLHQLPWSQTAVQNTIAKWLSMKMIQLCVGGAHTINERKNKAVSVSQVNLRHA